MPPAELVARYVFDGGGGAHGFALSLLGGLALGALCTLDLALRTLRLALSLRPRALGVAR